MSKVLSLMHQKIETMRHGMLRLKEGDGQARMQVSTCVYDGQSLNCVFNEQDNESRLLNREVVLIQKNGDDYFYITGHVDDEVEKNAKVVSLKITSACWFIRKKKGNVVWMQQKYFFELPVKKIS